MLRKIIRAFHDVFDDSLNESTVRRNSWMLFDLFSGRNTSLLLQLLSKLHDLAISVTVQEELLPEGSPTIFTTNRFLLLNLHLVNELVVDFFLLTAQVAGNDRLLNHLRLHPYKSFCLAHCPAHFQANTLHASVLRWHHGAGGRRIWCHCRRANKVKRVHHSSRTSRLALCFTSGQSAHG